LRGWKEKDDRIKEWEWWKRKVKNIKYRKRKDERISGGRERIKR
jgi:hypothetical protein